MSATLVTAGARFSGVAVPARLTRTGGAVAAAMAVGAGLSLRNPLLFLLGLGLVVVWTAFAGRHRAGVAAGVLMALLFTRVSDLPWLDSLPMSIAQAVVVLGLVLVVVDRRWPRPSRLAWDPVLSWMLLYSAAIGISAVTAADHIQTAAALIAQLRDVLIAWVVLSLITCLADLRVAAWSLLAAGTLLALAGLADALTGFDLGGLSTLAVQLAPDELSVRLDGPVGLDSNVFAQQLVLVTPLALYLGWTTSHRAARWTALAALVVTGAASMWTFSRGGFLGLLVVLGSAALLERAHRARLATIALVLVAIVLVAPQLYWTRLGFTVGNAAEVATGRVPTLQAARPTRTAAPFDAATPVPLSGAALVATAAAVQHERTPGASGEPGRKRTDDSIFDRSSLIRVSLLMLADHPLTGIGRGNYFVEYPTYANRVDPNLPTLALGPHNMLVQIAAESGLLGTATFAALILSAGVGLRRARARLPINEARLLDAIGLAVASYLVTGLFLNDSIYDRSLWLLLALCAAGSQLARHGSRAGP
jgi:hypothetical protein